MTIKEAYAYGLEHLKLLYQENESEAIIKLILENITDTEKTKRFFLLSNELSPKEKTRYIEIIDALQSLQPIQYILKEAWFYNERFYVDSNVLIPRPETEELVHWIINDYKTSVAPVKILDIGTGSGCIPITLKRNITKAEAWGCDVSFDALAIAKKNADNLETELNFVWLDFLDKKNWEQLPVFDIIVSNPPYIPEINAAKMDANVLKFEPSIALFVPDEEPLLFYNAIAAFGKTHLAKDGKIYMEIHEDFGQAVTSLFTTNGYHCELKKDMQQKDRMIKSGLL